MYWYTWNQYKDIRNCMVKRILCTWENVQKVLVIDENFACIPDGWQVKVPNLAPASSHRTAGAWILSLDLASPEVRHSTRAAQLSDGGSKLGLLRTQRGVTEQQELDPIDGRLKLQFRTQRSGCRTVAVCNSSMALIMIVKAITWTWEQNTRQPYHQSHRWQGAMAPGHQRAGPGVTGASRIRPHYSNYSGPIEETPQQKIQAALS